MNERPVYPVGARIVYGTSGVCEVKAVGTPEFAHVDRAKRYYTLSPVYGTEIIYVPVDTSAFMRPVMTRAEAEALIARIPAIREEWVETKNLQLLSEHYQASLRSHDCADLVHLIKTIYAKSATAQRSGKKPSTIDQRYRKRAEELLHGELAVALDIPRESVPAYIRARLDQRPAPRARVSCGEDAACV